MKSLGVWEEVSREECWRNTGREPITTKWVDVNKGRNGEIQIRSRLVARDVRTKGHYLQFDAFAAEGSSGSPIFDSRGFVIAVLYGGAAESGGRIIYAVPARKLADQMPSEAQGIIR